MDEGDVAGAILSRRSLRRFTAEPVDPKLVRRLVRIACAAPAPHHSRPWRFVHLTSAQARERLADAMGEAWLADLTRENRSVHEIDRLLGRSRRQVLGAPALLLGCVSLEEARRWPDGRRRWAERDMFVQSLGAALQNLLLAAHECGLAGYLKGAPLFCPGAVREALDLPPAWAPAFLVLLGYPEEGAVPPPRREPPPDTILLER